ncbi:MAG: TylF/MycF/NovP-related O-methyltransferase [Lautropia sp.]
MAIDNYLTYFPHLGSRLRNGRSVADGYARGWGLQFGDLRAKVAADPLYVEASKLSAGRSIVSEENRMNLFLIIRFFLSRLPAGNIIEFGSYRGGTALFMSFLAARIRPDMMVYALDTFAGMPATNPEVDAHGQGDFADVDLAEIESVSREAGLTNLRLVKGLFEDTAPDVLAEAGPIALAHIDCDIQSAVQYSYEVTKPSMVEGGYWVFDDATYSSCIGATEVIESRLIRQDGLNSEQIFPQYVFRAFRGTSDDAR